MPGTVRGRRSKSRDCAWTHSKAYQPPSRAAAADRSCPSDLRSCKGLRVLGYKWLSQSNAAERVNFAQVAEGLRITEAGRSRMVDELASTGLTDLVAGLAKRYSLEAAELGWQETPDPEGYNTSRSAAYQLIVPGVDNRPALLASLWLSLPLGREAEVRAIVDLCVDFEAIQPAAEPVTPAQIPSELRITSGELVRFFTSGWQAAEALLLTTGQRAADLPPSGASRSELYIQNRHPTGSDGQRVLRTQDLVDLSVFGRTRRSQLRDLSVGVTAPLGLDTGEIGSLVRQALVRMASDFGFTAAETAQL